MRRSESRADRYRKLAAICREKGNQTAGAAPRALMLEVAATWERLAALEERRVEQTGPPEQGTDAPAPEGSWRKTSGDGAGR
jgi:hypothetical protein